MSRETGITNGLPSQSTYIFNCIQVGIFSMTASVACEFRLLFSGCFIQQNHNRNDVGNEYDGSMSTTFGLVSTVLPYDGCRISMSPANVEKAIFDGELQAQKLDGITGMVTKI